MKILIIGAAGGTGQQLVHQALFQGHEVAAFVRTKEKIKLAHDRLRTVEGDVTDADSVAAAVLGQEAVLWAIGASDPTKQTTMLSDGTRHVIAAMNKHNVRRLIVITVLGAGDSVNHGGWLYDDVMIPFYLKNTLEDKNRQEKVIQESDTDWTIVRPPMLTNNAPMGAYRVITEGDEVVKSIARADVAGFMLAQLDNSAYIRKTPRLGY